MIEPQLTATDLARLAARGLDEDEAHRQFELLRARPVPRPIVRPCTLQDGITQIEAADHPGLLALWHQAAAGGRVSKFVPASGAATRMFAGLETAEGLAGQPGLPGPPTAAAREIHSRRAEFAFAEALATAAPGDDVTTTVDALVSPEGLALGSLPKALIPFHAYPAGPRSALVEHLVEAAGYAVAEDQAIKVHFTVTAGHRELMETLVEDARPDLERRFGAPFAVDFSDQDPASDTLAVDDDGAPARDSSGELILRPAGHGALLSNLGALDGGGSGGGRLVVIKNIDNIQPEHRQPEVCLWKRLLIGRLVQFESDLQGLGRRVEAGGPDAEAAAQELAELLGLEVQSPDLVSWAKARLARPARVCGMVRNTGEPGGGPFWVQGDSEAATPQIVEAAQIDHADPVQEAAWRDATHFNPVDLVCSLDDRQGEPYDLMAFVDPSTSFVSRKESAGRGLWALERPGLWNGAMAGWNTLFVEVPGATFAPVKTVLDLLRPEHQPAGV